MKEGRAVLTAVAVGCLLAAQHSAVHAVDSASLEFASGNETSMVRLGIQWKWTRQWMRSNGRHIGGYWDLNLAQWRADRFEDMPGQTQHITSIGITPVFRYQNDTLKGFYAEAAIGAHVLSEHYNNNGRQLSTNFEFGDHVGIGYVFENNADLGFKIQHFSNGGIKNPNNGVNFVVVRFGYPF